MFKMNQNSESLFVVYSSFLYCILGIFLFIKQDSPILAAMFFLIGISAFLHHSYPKSYLFRIPDWLGSFVIIFLVATNYRPSWTSSVFALLLILLWYFSFYSFHKTHNMHQYELTHTLWHILSVVFLFWLINP